MKSVQGTRGAEARATDRLEREVGAKGSGSTEGQEGFRGSLALERNTGGVCQVVKWGRAPRKTRQYKKRFGRIKENWKGVQENGSL